MSNFSFSHKDFYPKAALYFKNMSSPVMLSDLVAHSERGGDFRPRAHLMIQTDRHQTTTGGLRLSITELAYECLLQYFDPHRDAPSVTWIDRKQLMRYAMVSVMERNNGCINNYIKVMQRTKQMLYNTDAVLFLSPDAKSFVEVHKKSFLESLVVILKTSVDKICIMDMSQRPSALV